MVGNGFRLFAYNVSCVPVATNNHRIILGRRVNVSVNILFMGTRTPIIFK